MAECTQCGDVLDAPCVFCGYSGEGYWQSGTHASACPWFEVGDFKEREAMLRSAVEAQAREIERLKSHNSDLHAELKDWELQSESWEAELARLREKNGRLFFELEINHAVAFARQYCDCSPDRNASCSSARLIREYRNEHCG